MTPSRTSNSDSETFGMVGRDAKLRQIIEIIKTVAPSDAAVLVEGESGTGKQLIAHAIHAQSHHCSRPSIRVNCAAIPLNQFETQLFGAIAAANGGTLLIDEIAEIPSHLQSKLFRVLQEQKPCRVIAITSRNTIKLMKDGLLKKDLYFCISTIKISVPPLRERLDDIPLIAQHFLDRFNTQYGRKIRGISRETVFCLLRYDWPGNIRELESVIQRAVLFCSGKKLVPECLPEELQDKDLRNMHFVIPPLVPIQEIEREAIVQTLARTSGNVKLSAKILQYPRPTFYRKLKKFGIRVDREGPKAELDV